MTKAEEKQHTEEASALKQKETAEHKGTAATSTGASKEPSKNDGAVAGTGGAKVHHHRWVRNDHFDGNVYDAHAGAEGNNRIDPKTALAQSRDSVGRILSGQLHLVQPMTTRSVPTNELFPGSPACLEIMGVTQHTRPGRAVARFDNAMVQTLMAEVDNGKRKFYGVKHERFAFDGNPRTDTWKVYVDGSLPTPA